MVVGADGGPWDDSTYSNSGARSVNQGLVKFICEHIRPINFLEFGSGLGGLAAGIARTAKTQYGYCIEPLIKSPYEQSLGLQLFNCDIFTQISPVELNQKFDLVLSIEVAEHIDRNNHAALFNYLVSRSSNWVVFSGARPGQGGVGHIAERPEEEWKQEFTDRGLEWSEELSALARSSSDERNVNHRKNLLVFRNTSRFKELDHIESLAKPHLQALLSLVERNGGYLGGNLFYVNLFDARGGMPVDSLRNKRLNLLEKSKLARSVIEVGFNAGHSCLLMLLANPSSRIVIVDNLATPYARDCFDYLNRAFPGRLTLKPGNCLEVLPTIEPGSVDLVHLDAGKEYTLVKDLDNLQKIVIRDHVLVIDDTHNKNIQAIIDTEVLSGRISSSPFSQENLLGSARKYKHLLARFKSCDTAKDKEIIRNFFERNLPNNLSSLGNERRDSKIGLLLDLIMDLEFNGIKGSLVFTDETSLLIGAQTISRFIARNIILIGHSEIEDSQQDGTAKDRFKALCLLLGIAQHVKEIDASQINQRLQAENPIAMVTCTLSFLEYSRQEVIALTRKLQPGGWFILELQSSEDEQRLVNHAFLDGQRLAPRLDRSDRHHKAYQKSI